MCCMCTYESILKANTVGSAFPLTTRGVDENSTECNLSEYRWQDNQIKLHHYLNPETKVVPLKCKHVEFNSLY